MGFRPSLGALSHQMTVPHDRNPKVRHQSKTDSDCERAAREMSQSRRHHLSTRPRNRHGRSGHAPACWGCSERCIRTGWSPPREGRRAKSTVVGCALVRFGKTSVSRWRSCRRSHSSYPPLELSVASNIGRFDRFHESIFPRDPIQRSYTDILYRDPIQCIR